MSEPEATMAQFEIMVDFMERNGDLSEFQEGNVKDELENLQKWIELTDILNDKRNGDPKPLDEWKKSWEILKTNAQTKFQRTFKKRQPKPTEIDIRIMAVMQINGGGINRKRKHTASSRQEDDEEEEENEKENNEEEENEEEDIEEFYNEEHNVTEDESSEQVRDEKDQVKADEELNNNKDIVKIHPNFYWALRTAMLSSKHSSLVEANFEASASAESLHRRSKRKKQDSKNYLEVAERYLEMEKKHAALEHEREMLEIKNTDKYDCFMGKSLLVSSTVLSKCMEGLLKFVNVFKRSTGLDGSRA